MARDGLRRCEPHTRLRFHVRDELFEVPHRRAMAAQVWMQGQHEQRALLVRAVEFVPVKLIEQCRARQPAVLPEERCFRERPVDWQLHDSRRLVTRHDLVRLVPSACKLLS